MIIKELEKLEKSYDELLKLCERLQEDNARLLISERALKKESESLHEKFKLILPKLKFLLEQFKSLKRC